MIHYYVTEFIIEPEVNKEHNIQIKNTMKPVFNGTWFKRKPVHYQHLNTFIGHKPSSVVKKTNTSIHTYKLFSYNNYI
jgi:hypothetical protein